MPSAASPNGRLPNFSFRARPTIALISRNPCPTATTMPSGTPAASSASTRSVAIAASRPIPAFSGSNPAFLHLSDDLDDLAMSCGRSNKYAAWSSIGSSLGDLVADDQVAILGEILQQRRDLLAPIEHVGPAPRLAPVEPAVGPFSRPATHNP
jgi:hypothetical protein